MPRTSRSLLARALTAVAVLGCVSTTFVPQASAQVVQPSFRMPFACDQTWIPRTYRGHEPNAIDWNMPGSGSADHGQPVLAGAAGVVEVRQHRGYGNMVIVDHGGGWTSLYAHLSSVDVISGQAVAWNTMVGRVGNTGRSDGSHLHHEQLLNGVRQQVVVDTVPLVPSYSSRGAAVTAAPCAPVVVPKARCESWPASVKLRCSFSERRQLP